MIDGSRVTFTNTSVDATSYIWGFGDGHFSTEKDPVYTYIINSDYLVKLRAFHDEESDLFSELITIDAPIPFAHWDEIPADRLAVATMPEDAIIEGAYVLKAYADSDSLYFYIEIDNYMSYFWLFIDSDNDGSTGADLYPWTDCGVDIVIESWSLNLAQEGGIYLYNPDYDDFYEFSAPGSGIISASDVITVINGNQAFEFSIARDDLPHELVDYIRIGIDVWPSDWSYEGVLPLTEEGNFGSPLLKVKVN